MNIDLQIQGNTLVCWVWEGHKPCFGKKNTGEIAIWLQISMATEFVNFVNKQKFQLNELNGNSYIISRKHHWLNIWQSMYLNEMYCLTPFHF